ncbi:MAG: 3-deoxy-8-phosphooctulonate synthase [Verrucomicrobiae bacterium]|nr:3-deoxy-8-phosphooctulonate synthase [Verrucomicrobiae bacterium]
MPEAQTKVTVVSVGPLRIGGAALALIAGPCVIESERLCMRVAERLAALAQRLRIPFIFKASYDKANRSSVRAFRGPGLKEGLKVLAKVNRDLGVPVLTDVHSVGEVAAAAEVCDVLQVPAFLCRQTDLVLAVARSGRAVNVKKGQFLAPRDMKNVVEKVESAGCQRLLLTERGVSFGYNSLVVDMRALPMMRAFGYPVIFDATHSVQQPGGAGDRSGGEAAFAPTLARAAVAAGCDGVFIETHPTPASALSDGPNMIPLRDMRGLLEQLCAIREALR